MPDLRPVINTRHDSGSLAFRQVLTKERRAARQRSPDAETAVDLLEIKGRIAVALAESVFRRAGFTVGPDAGPGGRGPRRRMGREDLVPDFAADTAGCRGRRPAGRAPRSRGVVEVRYRPRVGQYLDRIEAAAAAALFGRRPRQAPLADAARCSSS